MHSTKKSLAPMAHDIEHARKVLVREFERFFDGLNLSDVTAHTFSDDKARWHAWTLETLIWTCARLIAGENKEALRGYAQAREYRGRNGGFWPSGICADAASEIQNEIESRF
jgi:hypothetical protein